MKNLRKFLALLLALCMLTGLLGTAAFAAGEGEEDTTETETVVCTKAEGCTAETHEEGCPKAPKDGTEPEEQPEEPAASPEQSPEQQPEQQPEEPSSDEATGENGIMPALNEVELEAASVSGTMTGADLLSKAVDGVITLDGDVTLTEKGVSGKYSLLISAQTYTVDLSGHTLTLGGDAWVNVTTSGNLTVKNGTILANAARDAVFDVKTNSALTLDHVEYETSGVGIYPRGDAAVVTVTDSTIKVPKWFAISTNAKANDDGTAKYAGVEINLTNSTFEGLAGVILNVPGELNMTNCTATGSMQGVIVRGGTAEIKNCVIKSTATDAGLTEWGTGNNIPNGALVVGNKGNSYQYPSNVTVDNQTTIITDGCPAVVVNSNADADKGVTLDLSGATIIGEVEYGNVVAMVDGKYYATLQAAIDAAEPTNGVITYEIYGKAEVTSTAAWIQVVKSGITEEVSAVKFVGKTDDAEICITNSTSILADQQYDIDVSFENLKLTHPNGDWVGDLGHSTNYFTCFLRNNNAAENTVTYTNCTFPNGVCNNQYGKTVFDSCTFNNNTTGKYNLWNYGGTTEVKNSEFTGTRGVKSYCEGTATNIAITISNTTFDGLTEKAAILVSKPTNVTLDNIGVTGSTGLLTTDISGNGKVQLLVSGEGISGTFNIGSDTSPETAKDEFNITGGTFSGDVSAYCAAGYEATVENGTWTVSKAKTPAEKVEIAIDEALNNNKFVGVIASKADGQLNQITATVDGRYNASLRIPYAKINTGSLTLGVGMEGVESLGMRPGEKRSHVLDTNLGHRIIDLGNDEYKMFLGFSDWNGFQVNTTVKDGAAENTVSYTFGVTQTNDDVTLNATTTADARAAWKAIFANATASTGTADSKIIVAEGSYLQAGTKKVTLEQPGDLVLDHFQNLNWAALRDMFRVEENAYTEDQLIRLFLKKGTTLAVGDSKVVLDKDVTISTESLKDPADVAQYVQMLASGALDAPGMAEMKKQIVAFFVGTFAYLPDNLNGTSMDITVEFAESVAEVNGKGYQTLQEAINAAEDGQTVTLLKSTVESVTVNNTVTLTIPANVTLTNEADKDTITVALGGTLTVTGGGTVDNVSHKCAAVYNNGTANLNGGIFTRSMEKGQSTTDNGGNSYYTIDNKGTMTINGATVKQDGGAAGTTGKYSSLIRNLGNAADNTAGTLTIENGTFSGGLNTVKNDDYGTLTIRGGSFSNTAQHVIMNWNVANISGGTFTATTPASSAVWNGYWQDGVGQGELNITGGEFIGTPAVMNAENYSGGTVTITDGLFSTNVSEYCENGKAAFKDANGKWTIKGAEGTITVLTNGGTVDGNTVTFGEGVTMVFASTGNDDGRTPDKWYAGIKVTAPEGVDINKATIQKIGAWWLDDGSSSDNWVDASGCKEDGQIWPMATPAYIKNYGKGTPKTLYNRYRFDWNADGDFDQEITLKIVEGVGFAQEGMIVEVNGIQYPTLAEAVADANAGDTVTLLKNATGSGVIINKNITIDFGGFTYTVAKAPLAGSGSKYATQAFQLLAGADKTNPNSVTMKNGTIVLPSTTENLKMGIQNYTNLTLDGVTIDAHDNGNITYVLSNNNGTTTITGGTVLKAAEGKVAFDVYDYSSNDYGNVTVSVKADSEGKAADITGTIEVSNSAKAKLTIEAGTFDTDVSKYVVEKKGQGTDGTVVDLTVTLNQTAADLVYGYRNTTVTLMASPSVKPADGTVAWSSSNMAVATVDANGVVTPVSAGSATITATVSGVKSEDCTVTVTRTYAPYVPPTNPDEDLDDPDVPLAGLPFVDVHQTDWFYGAVSTAYLRELMIGITTTEFAPEALTNRGSVATLLFRMENEPDAEMSDFSDVMEGQWYTPAINWANQAGVMIGYDTGVFQPEGGITREQLALTFFRYRRMKGLSVEARADLSTFADADRVSVWAKEAMEWAVGCGLFEGTPENSLAPQGFTKRSELAAVLQRFLEMD